MKRNIKKFVYELSQNARIQTKELGKKLRVSQQSASYLLQSFRRKKKILSYSTIIDPSKCGYLQVLVYLNFSDFDSKKIKKVVNFLKEDGSVVSIEYLRQGYDLAIVYCVTNLSLYNKKIRGFLQKFKKAVSLAETYPIIVKHIYPKKYLSPRTWYSEVVISGDRDVIGISEREKTVLFLLHDNPTESIVNMYKKSKLNPKTIIRIKKNLEKNKIIRGYRANFDLDQISIIRKHLLINSRNLSLEEDKKISQFALTHPNIVSLVRLIGNYDILIEIEEETTKKDVLKDLRTTFPIYQYRMIECGKTIKNKFIPKDIV